VTFSRIPYATVVARSKAQDKIVNTGMMVSLAAIAGGAAFAAVKFGPRALHTLQAIVASKLA
jgi:hypothetical protein